MASSRGRIFLSGESLSAIRFIRVDTILYLKKIHTLIFIPAVIIDMQHPF